MKSKFLLVFLSAFLFFTNSTSISAQLQVGPAGTPESMAEYLSGTGVQLINPTINCAEEAYGRYTASNIDNFSTEEGLIFSTGNAANAIGPNNVESSTTVFDNAGDPTLDLISSLETFDGCVFEFDVIPVGDTIRFDFIFASEEYQEYVGTPFNDVFGFFISGPGITGDPGLGGYKNIALIPGTNTPVAISTVNNGNPGTGFIAVNPEFYHNNPLNLNAAIQYDGWTEGLYAESAVNACDTFHLKIAIADVSDYEWDSGVFISKIESNGISVASSTEGNIENMVEGCNDGTVIFQRAPVTADSLQITYFIGGTATNGIDYPLIGISDDPEEAHLITIPAGESSVSFDISPFSDGLAEGDETIIFYLANDLCPGAIQDSLVFIIQDSLTVSIEPALADICVDSSLTFQVINGGSDFSWSPADYLDDPNIKEPTTSPEGDIIYTLTTTAAECVATAQSEVRLSEIFVDAEISDIICGGTFTGAIDITVTGSNPFTYEWIVPGGSMLISEDLANVEAGMYSLLVEDRNGCTRSFEYEISELPEIALDLNSPEFIGGNNISCFGASDGQASVNAVGGTAPYTYLWDDVVGQTTSTASGLSAGTYTVTVSDANLCTEVGSITLSQPESVTGSLEEREDVLCFGGNNGFALISAEGGIPPYSYLWNSSPPQTGTMASNLSAGIYTVFITDINDCVATVEVEIDQPEAGLSADLDIQNVFCNGDATGSVSAIVSGGTEPYTYTWSSDITLDEDSISGLAAGSYTLSISDANDCVLNIPFSITQPSPILINISEINNVSCLGSADGSITVSASGGQGPYSYSWDTSPPLSGSSISGLDEGSYTVTVTDSNDCTDQLTIEIEEADEELEIEISELIMPSCNGFDDGEITVNATGGSPDYTYTWLTVPPVNGTTISNIGAGSYTVSVTDGNGCEETLLIEVTEPEELNLSINNIEHVLCSGNSSGSISVDVSGGTEPYTYLWNDPLSQTEVTADSLPAGTYMLILTDANGCSATINAEVSEPEFPLSAEITDQVNVLCHGESTGSATVTASGGSGSYSYQWNDAANQQTSTASNLAAGTYEVTITDNNGCDEPVIVQVEITQPDDAIELLLEPSEFTNGTNFACHGDTTGTIDLTISGGVAPYEIEWNLPGTETSSDEDLFDLAAGTYTVTVTDANDCSVETSITLIEPPAIVVDFTMSPSLCFGLPSGSLSIEVSGGIPPYDIEWEGPGGFTSDETELEDLLGGLYTLTITDGNTCVFINDYTVTQPEDLVIDVDSLSSFGDYNTRCYNSNDGAIYISPSGGTGSYNYTWNTSGNLNFSNQEDVFNVSPGLYEIVLTDGNNCIQNEFIEIIGPDTLLIDFIPFIYPNGFNVSCAGADDGSINTSISGGTPGYNYFWVGPDDFVSMSSSIEDLTAGLYALLVTDANNCFYSNDLVITEPNLFDINLIAESNNGEDISCQGGSDGAINLIMNGGGSPFNIVWTGPDGFTSSSEDIFGLTEGEYCVVVTDANDCVQEECITLTAPQALDVTLTSPVMAKGTNISCFEGSDGAINTAFSGGTGPYSFAWTGPQSFSASTQNIIGLSAGEYCLTITDANDCEITSCIILTEPVEIDILFSPSFFGDFNISCSETSDGSINISLTGAFDPITYSWTGPDGFTSTDADISDLEGGTYCLEVSDVYGCFAEECITLMAPPPIIINLTTENIDCSGNSNGDINTNVNGGSEPYTYSWTGPDSFTSSEENLENLVPGEYCLEITDANNCGSIMCIDISEPAPLIADPIITNGDCSGEINATVDLNISGGTEPYTFNWSSGDDTEVVVDLESGSYDIIITDANGCSINTTLEVDNPLPIDLSLISNTFPGGFNISCFGNTDGEIDLSVNGGEMPYIIDWEGPAGFTSTSEDINTLAAGVYIVSVTDVAGCVETDSIELIQPLPLTASFDLSAVSCSGDNDGVITVTAAGGSPAYTFNWTGPNGFEATGSSISNLEVGNYCVNIEDVNGCTVLECVDITEPSPINTSLSSPLIDGVNIPCNGNATGEINTLVNGGSGPYTFSWTGPEDFTSTLEDIEGLLAGEYCLTVTDNENCTFTECITLTEADPFDIAFTTFVTPFGFNVTCPESCDGSIETTNNSGSGPFIYSWNGPNGFTSNDEDIQDLCAGTYLLSVTDTANCSQIFEVIISEPEPINIDLESPEFNGGFEISCFGSSTGSIFTELSGGNGAYVISWSGPESFSSDEMDLENLIAGTYTATVTDAAGCADSGSITLEEPASALDASIEINEFPSGHNISCMGASDGSAISDVSGGTAPYSYNWTGPGSFNSSDPDLEGAGPGEYQLIIEDANSCVFTILFELTEPESILETDAEITAAIACFGEGTAAISVEAEGGNPDYEINWNGPDNFSSDQFSIDDLISGTYTYTVSDINGCESTEDININEPEEILIDAQVINALCATETGSILIAVSGGMGDYTYLWSDESTEQDLLDVNPGEYEITVTDENNCTAEAEFIIESDNNLSAGANITHLQCFGDSSGAIELLLENAQVPLEIEWTGPGNFTSGSLNINDLVAGTYTVDVSDLNGCEISEEFIVNEPSEIIISDLFSPVYNNGFNISTPDGSDGSIEHPEISGGHPPYEIIWTGPDDYVNSSMQDLINLEAGQYTITVIDSSACRAESSIVLTEPQILELPNGISPNGDGSNDFLFVKGLDHYPQNTLRVYNRWGNIVYEESNYTNTMPWYGQNQEGDELPDGTYFVFVEIDGAEDLNAYLEIRR